MQEHTTTKQGVLVKYRYGILVLSLLLFLPPLSLLFQVTQDSSFCGAWCPRMFFSWRKGMQGSEFLMGFLRSYMGVVLVAGVLASTLFLGRHWCSHLCPVGGSMELGSRLVPGALRLNYAGIAAPAFRYGYLAVYLLAPAAGLGSLCCNYCNFATVPRFFGAAFSSADMAYFLRAAGLVNLGLFILLGLMARGGRAYCNLLCPVGALDSLVNRLGAGCGKRVRVDGLKCNGCGACATVCPTWAITVKGQAAIDHLSCMPCRQCENVCAKEAIRYGKP